MNQAYHMLFVALSWLTHTGFATAIKESTWLFPAIETIHVFGIVYLVGATTIIDLRLLGVAFRLESITSIHDRFMPWIWVGFGVQFITGFLLFASEALRMADNKSFLLKMFLIAVAGVNAAIYERWPGRAIKERDNDEDVPVGARICAIASIVLWMAVITAGRWIAYV